MQEVTVKDVYMYTSPRSVVDESAYRVYRGRFHANDIGGLVADFAKYAKPNGYDIIVAFGTVTVHPDNAVEPEPSPITERANGYY
jgi:hypothetical protein